MQTSHTYRLVIALACLAVVACAAPSEDPSEVKGDADLSTADAQRDLAVDLVMKATEADLGKLCDLAAGIEDVKDHNAELFGACSLAVVASSCRSVANGLADGVKEELPTARELTPGQFSAFKGALATCVGEGYSALAPHLRRTFPSLYERVSSALPSRTDTPDAPPSSAEIRREAVRQVALAACSAAGNHVARHVPEIDFENACNVHLNFASCGAVLADACDAMAGSIDVQEFLPETETATQELLVQIANVGLDAACSTPGIRSGFDPRKAACSVITSALGQIKMAIVTGNNQYASCLGTAQAGACVGDRFQNWMQGTRSGDTAAPVNEKYVAPSGFESRQVCVCNHSCYVNDYGGDTLLKRTDKFFTVISAGGAGTRQCANEEGKRVNSHLDRDGFQVYGYLSGCQVRAVYRNSSAEDYRYDVSGGSYTVKSDVHGACQ